MTVQNSETSPRTSSVVSVEMQVTWPETVQTGRRVQIGAMMVLVDLTVVPGQAGLSARETQSTANMRLVLQ